MIPNEHCYTELDPSRVDQWGIPILRFHWKWSDHEINQATHMQNTFADIINGRDAPKALGSAVTDLNDAWKKFQ